MPENSISVITGATGAIGTYSNTNHTEKISYTDFENAYTTYSTCISDYQCSSSPGTYQNECKLCEAINVISNNIQSDPSYNALLTNYNNLANKRNDLDLKLQDLYNIDNSIPNLYNLQTDSTVYTGILWTVLATTLIYYVFIKL